MSVRRAGGLGLYEITFIAPRMLTSCAGGRHAQATLALRHRRRARPGSCLGRLLAFLAVDAPTEAHVLVRDDVACSL